MKRFRIGSTLGAALAAAALFLAGPALAQQGSPPGQGQQGSPPGQQGQQGTPPGQGGTSAADFTDSQLESFAAAQDEVQKVGQEYQQKVRNADPQEMAAIRQEMNEEMAEAVRGSGLDIGTYNEIASASQSDPALAEKIESLR